jgi:RecA-family ATPase
MDRRSGRERVEREAERAEQSFEREQEHERRVRDAVEHLRVAQEARQRLDRASYPPWPRETLASVLARPSPPPPERVAELLPADGNALLVAQYKTGKTTLTLNLAAALADGKPFLDTYKVEPVEGRIAFLNYEMSEWQLSAWTRDMEIERPDRIVPWNLRGRTTPFHDERFRDELCDWLVGMNVTFLIIDPAARAWSGCVDNENDNTQIGAFTTAIDEVKRDAGITEVVLAHHTGRYAQEEGKERGRGATRLEDWPDALWYLTRDERRRSLRAEGRDVYVEASDLDYDEATRRLMATGSTRRQRQRDDAALAAIQAVAEADKPLLAHEIDAASGIASRGRQQEARSVAVERGWLTEQPAPRNGRLYTLTEAGRDAIQTV